ncbi:MAG: VOC family protein [Pseudomonadota bacterium]
MSTKPKMARLEHVNITVADADAKAARLCDLFGWHIRWQGEAMNGVGKTIHVGGDDFYLAIYSPHAGTDAPARSSYLTHGGLNHVAVVVDDIDAMEKRVAAAGYEPGNHGDYEPGRRFYYHDEDGIEFEVVSYD